MKLKKVYRWTKLSEWLRIIDNQLPKKYLYRISDKQEARSYALANKLEDAQARWSLVEARLNMSWIDLYHLTNEEYQQLFTWKESKITHWKVSVKDFWVFQIFLVPPKFQHIIKQPKIIEVV